MQAIVGEPEARPGDIMIVDDNPANLKLLEEMLLQKGHEVRSFPLGRLALAAAFKNPPDLILLDINMPEMNGYEVCARLKATEAVSSIPVIFLSALTETGDKVKAFQSGAVDYISKPFQLEEVHARVETQIRLHQLQQDLKRHNEQLEEAVAARTRELANANERLTILDRSKNEFLSLISHEFRTPLNGLLGVGELLIEQIPSTLDNEELISLFERSRVRILSILDDAMLLTQIDVSGTQFRSTPVSLRVALSRAIESAMPFALSRRVALIMPAAHLDPVLGEEELLVRALHALFETAVRFSSPDETVQLSYEPGSDAHRLIIESRGKSIPASLLEGFFDIFSIHELMNPGEDLGLAPAVANRVLSLFGASVSVVNKDSPGIRLAVMLKSASPRRVQAS